RNISDRAAREKRGHPEKSFENESMLRFRYRCRDQARAGQYSRPQWESILSGRQGKKGVWGTKKGDTPSWDYVVELPSFHHHPFGHRVVRTESKCSGTGHFSATLASELSFCIVKCSLVSREKYLPWRSWKS
ncbi:hypothetical protein RvY_08277, partial [Ramazzottius varieornatus]